MRSYFEGGAVRDDAAALVYKASDGADYAGRKNANFDFDVLRGTDDVFGRKPVGEGPRRDMDVSVVIVDGKGGPSRVCLPDLDDDTKMDFTFETRTQSHGPRILFQSGRAPGAGQFVMLSWPQGI